MNPQERDVISGIFERAKQAANMPRDPDAEQFIADRIREQPYAPYVMAQAIHVQEQALAQLNQEVEQLKGQVAQMQAQAQQQQQGGGFLSGLFGGGARPEQPRSPQPGRPMGAAPQAPSGPWGGQPQQGYGQPQQGSGQAPQAGGGGMGFLGTAASAAVGVAGGILAANALKGMFGGGNEAQAANGSQPNAQQSSHENEEEEGGDYSDSADLREASYDDSGSDFGGGGDFSDA